MWKVIVSLILLVLSPGGDGLFHSIYKNTNIPISEGGNPGLPLFLTPYITAKKLREGKWKEIGNPVFLFGGVYKEITCQHVVFTCNWLQCTVLEIT